MTPDPRDRDQSGDVSRLEAADLDMDGTITILDLTMVANMFHQKVPGPTQKRDRYKQPFAVNSIWNQPLGSSRVVIPAGIKARGYLWRDQDIVGLDPAAPVRTVTTPQGSRQVRVPVGVTWGGGYNGCGGLLDPNNANQIHQFYKMTIPASGNCSAEWLAPWTTYLDGDGRQGGHGGSQLSSIGGTIRKHEVGQSIPHALKILVHHADLSPANGGFRWPANLTDSYWQDPLNGQKGTVPDTRMGSLVCLPANFDAAGMGAQAKLIVMTLQLYGAYICDDAYGADQMGITIERGATISVTDEEARRIWAGFYVVANNTPTSIGGGGTPVVPLAAELL